MGRPGTPETGRRNAEREITLLPMHLGVPKTQRYICLPRLLFCIIRETIKAPPWQDCFEAKMKLCMERASYIACYSFTHFINCHALLWARHCARHRRSTQQMASRVSVFVILIGLGEPSILTSGSSDCGRQMQRDPSFLLSLHPSQFPDLLFGIPPPGIHPSSKDFSGPQRRRTLWATSSYPSAMGKCPEDMAPTSQNCTGSCGGGS